MKTQTIKTLPIKRTRRSRLGPATCCAALVYLDKWLGQQSDGDWEHQHGVELTTTDNPGWWLKIDLDGTSHHNLAVKMRNKDWQIEAMDQKLTAYSEQGALAKMLTKVVEILAQHNDEPSHGKNHQ